MSGCQGPATCTRRVRELFTRHRHRDGGAASSSNGKAPLAHSAAVRTDVFRGIPVSGTKGTRCRSRGRGSDPPGTCGEPDGGCGKPAGGLRGHVEGSPRRGKPFHPRPGLGRLAVTLARAEEEIRRLARGHELGGPGADDRAIDLDGPGIGKAPAGGGLRMDSPRVSGPAFGDDVGMGGVRSRFCIRSRHFERAGTSL